MPNNNYILTSQGSFLSEEELYHYGVPGMKWGHRKAKLLDKANISRQSAKEWDEMEYALQNNEFWRFLTSDEDYPARIELLFKTYYNNAYNDNRYTTFLFVFCTHVILSPV